MLATILRVICPIFNDRDQSGGADASIVELDRRVRDPSWPQVLLWPEGTTHNRMAAIRHKVGAYKPGLPVQALVLRFPNRWTSDIWTFKLWFLFFVFSSKTSKNLKYLISHTIFLRNPNQGTRCTSTLDVHTDAILDKR